MRLCLRLAPVMANISPFRNSLFVSDFRSKARYSVTVILSLVSADMYSGHYNL